MFPPGSWTNLDPLPAEDADHGGQGEEEEAGEADRQHQDDALVCLRGLGIREHGVRFSCRLSALRLVTPRSKYLLLSLTVCCELKFPKLRQNVDISC